MEKKLALKNLVSMEDLSKEEVLQLIYRAQAFKGGASTPSCEKIFVANLFFENSTRTHRSFEVAENKLNMKVIEFDATTSSVQKGESLYDTVGTFNAIGVDVLVIRAKEEEYYNELLQSPLITASLINGGDGSGQHPSQCLLDLMTIYESFGHFAGLKVAIVGDLRHSRVARSNMQMLKRLGAELYFSGPVAWFTPEFAEYGTYLGMDELVGLVDVLMLLRVQHERHTSSSEAAFSKEEYHEKFGLTTARYEKMAPQGIIMHPAPVNRDVEIASSLVESPKSKIFTQMTNGMFMRMAILEAIVRGRSLEEAHDGNLN
ncbi:aspartate carbamoyltransferase catalytic subunit [Enterococcus nangangensis]|uniref:aspartate carbamoyltransferase catalytic subunit n=1 Tax=Enterococcus nangangensis TaxID=2559926 RepID=UPI0010F8D99B|nr:aspartate carbamoyltransferase catalytic subunit [Enterococcus nangangensis]